MAKTVAHNAATKRNNHGPPVTFGLQESIEDAAPDLQRFIFFAVRQNNLERIVGRQSGAKGVQIERRHDVIGDDCSLGALDIGNIYVPSTEQPRPDVNRVATVAEFDAKSLHGAAATEVWKQSLA